MTRKVTEEEVGLRLDSLLATDPAISRSAAARLIEEGAVTVNGELPKRRYLVRLGDLIEVALPEPVPAEATPEDIPLSVVYE
ncbi:MAG: RNA pseudouridine synthase, partial [Clostridia bacterium]|nr:RNA pseudouridine synthase [Clostridia bacterium]